MPRHEDRLPHDGLDFHRAYPDSHNIHAHAMMIGEDLTARDRLEVMPLDRWQLVKTAQVGRIDEAAPRDRAPARRSCG